MCIGDVSLPLCDAVIKALHEVVYEAFIEDEILPHRADFWHLNPVLSEI